MPRRPSRAARSGRASSSAAIAAASASAPPAVGPRDDEPELGVLRGRRRRRPRRAPEVLRGARRCRGRGRTASPPARTRPRRRRSAGGRGVDAVGHGRRPGPDRCGRRRAPRRGRSRTTVCTVAPRASARSTRRGSWRTAAVHTRGIRGRSGRGSSPRRRPRVGGTTKLVPCTTSTGPVHRSMRGWSARRHAARSGVAAIGSHVDGIRTPGGAQVGQTASGRARYGVRRTGSTSGRPRACSRIDG